MLWRSRITAHYGGAAIALQADARRSSSGQQHTFELPVLLSMTRLNALR